MELYRPTSGTEGDYFQSRYCDRCVNDDPDNDKFCDILGRTMALGEDDEGYPTEWRWQDGKPVCIAFSTWQENVSREAMIEAEKRGQLRLFAR